MGITHARDVVVVEGWQEVGVPRVDVEAPLLQRRQSARSPAAVYGGVTCRLRSRRNHSWRGCRIQQATRRWAACDSCGGNSLPDRLRCRHSRYRVRRVGIRRVSATPSGVTTVWYTGIGLSVRVPSATDSPRATRRLRGPCVSTGRSSVRAAFTYSVSVRSLPAWTASGRKVAWIRVARLRRCARATEAAAPISRRAGDPRSDISATAGNSRHGADGFRRSAPCVSGFPWLGQHIAAIRRRRPG